MASTFKSLTGDDVVSTRTLLHESIPVTGSIVSGTYESAGGTTEYNIKNYTHGMFQSVYDYPYLSSSANHIFDITCGYSNDSSLSGAENVHITQEKKINIYNQMAQVLVGHDATGAIRKFDQDGDIIGGGVKISECVFLNFARLLTKDEVKKGSFSLTFLTGGAPRAILNMTEPTGATVCSDYLATDTSNFYSNSPAGEYGILYTASANTDATSGVGLVYYQAGIAVVTASIFSNTLPHAKETAGTGEMPEFGSPAGTYDTGSIDRVLSGASIQNVSDGVRNRLQSVSFNNTTELNSTVHFCRINHNEFNYSSNPTYLSGSKIRVKSQQTDEPISYVTSVGLYSPDNELLAVAKLSEPLKKTTDNEITLRVRLDY